VIPDSLLKPIVSWHHERLGHAGSRRLYDTVASLFYHGEQLKATAESTVTRCRICQEVKPPERVIGQLAPREAPLAPWDEVHVDCIGPWTIKLPGQQEDLVFDALTCIDPVTNIVELIRVESKTADYIAMTMENNWLARYPRPQRCVHDNGPEFVGFEFKVMLYHNGIQDKPTAKLNPQSNAVCERMHRTVNAHIRVLLREQPPGNAAAATHIVDMALAASMYALRASVNRATQTSDSVMAFNRDMILHVPLLADLALIRNRCQVIIDEQYRRASLKSYSFDYQPGQQVFLRVKNPSKLGKRSTGPYDVVQVHTNGTITIRRRANVVERLNIRRVYPFQQ
jgi:transposase InsO family protein